jgi:hypothetical protein
MNFIYYDYESYLFIIIMNLIINNIQNSQKIIKK